MPKSTYHQEPEDRTIWPAKEATTPKVVKVRAMPSEYATEYLSDVFELPGDAPPTYATIRGTDERLQGVNAVKTPAINAKTGANQKL